MATRCRSAKCAAERRGARRELETWRHKLIACVGFESILEGIYGPRLLQDLSIFEDCEPEAASDWSTDARCPFCNLQLEKTTDHVPVSPPPAETPPPQGLSTSEKLQCQADQFLHAVFHKKEFPENCDPSIPLAAQELMRKMIRQFAIEYACKSQPEGAEDPNPSQADFPKQAEPDGPLDLTISRSAPCRDITVNSVTHCPQQDGVLDLSKKSTSSSQNVANHQAVSGSLVPADEDHCSMEEEREKPEDWRGTVLEKVLSSLCSNHRPLLYHILQNMRQDHSMTLALRDTHRRLAKPEPLCPPAEQTSPSDALPCSISGCAAGCLTACGFRTCAVGSVCICVKSLTCQNLALGCVSKVVCQSSAVCCTHHKMLVCQHQCSVAHAGNVSGVRGVQMKPAGVLHLCNACRTCRSPTPPSLLPLSLEMENKTGGNKCESCKDQESAEESKLPSLSPQPTETCDEEPALQSGAHRAAAKQETKQEQNKLNCGSSLLGEIMDEFREKLKNIQPNEREQTPDIPQTPNTCGTQLTEIITTVLRSSSSSVKEYNLKELFNKQRMATETRSPLTRSRRRREEELAALSLSPDLPASRRQSLQNKRCLARLDPSTCRRKLEMDRGKCPKNIQPHVPSTSSCVADGTSTTKSIKQPEVDSRTGGLPRPTSERQKPQDEQEKRPGDLAESQLGCNKRDIRQPSSSSSDKKSLTKTKKSHEDKKSQMFHPNNNVGRSRRNIVPPQRFSSYVTEPRKMFYAACFSESIFEKHSPDVSLTSECDSAKMICVSEPPIKSEAQGCESHKINTLRVSPRRVRSCEDNSGETCDSEQTGSGDHVTPTKKPRLCRVRNVMNSQSPKSILGQSSETNGHEDSNSSKSSAYVSPIKLMLVSCIKSEDGVKYSLKAPDSGSNPSGEMFDPCIEASWAGSSETKQTLNESSQTDLNDAVQNDELTASKTKPPQVIAADEDEVDLINLTNRVDEASPAARETTPFKRRPGRPKKLGPQIEKSVKRPIGRPPKVKTGEPSCSNTENVNQKVSEQNSKDDENKNLKITILYGRSRKTRRVVSEDLEHHSLDQHSYEVQSSTSEGRKMKINTSEDSILNPNKSQFEDLHFVKPVEDRKGFVHASSNVKCQKQSDLAVARKPGRPAKVKISGISVTVTTVSPRQRRIHMKKDAKESQRRALLMEFEPSKEQTTINERTNVVLDDLSSTMEEGTEHSGTSFAPIRHSVRERKPSVHLLHSVATARSFSRSNALVCRSHKLLMSKARNSETNHTVQLRPEVAANKTQRKTKHVVSHMKNAVRFSRVSVDSIFALNESYKWWSTSASQEILNKELARRIRLMSDTWVSDVLEAKKSEEVQIAQKPKDAESDEESSAVKMLFERNYSMEKLSSWFMQTTETQSLSIVKKASARNPYEVFHYSPIRSPCRENVCPSPQAERLRKHVKKFAQVIPKSPTVHRQALAYEARRSLVKRILFNSSKFNLRQNWRNYKTALQRARSKFRSNAKKTKITTKVQKARVKTADLSKKHLRSENGVLDAVGVLESKSPKTDASEQVVGFTGTLKEQRILSKAWSPETLKECSVFLKKINSPSSPSVTVHTISPAGCDVPVKQEEQKDSGNTKLQETPRRSPRKPHSSLTTPTKSGENHRRSQASESSPAKNTRQSRSSRGVLAAKWSDFVIGPSR